MMQMRDSVLVEGFRELKDAFVDLLDAISALGALSSVRVGVHSERELLEKALHVLMQNQDLERCSVFMVEEGERLVNAAGLDWDDLIARGPRQSGQRPAKVFRLGEGLVGRAAATAEMQYAADCSRDRRFAVDGAMPMVGSLIAAPIKSGEQVVGVLNVSHPHENFFSDSHRRTLAIFCNFLGQLLANNDLLLKMDEQVALRTQQLEQALAEAHELRRRYEALSILDELTGLNNRRFFFEEARKSLAHALRHRRPFAVLLADVDLFKQVNDMHGHAVGDEVLKGVAAVLREVVREGDILARYGGEEFVLALADLDAEGACALAERLRAALAARRWHFAGQDVVVTVTVGIACSANRGGKEDGALARLDRLLSEADQALYFGKHRGRNQVNAFEQIACHL